MFWRRSAKLMSPSLQTRTSSRTSSNRHSAAASLSSLREIARHSTDPDHVIAVSTIVSRERSITKAALIGILWGCGHTLTIFAVGAAIILFGLAIPARIGLTMEFSVGLM